MIIEQFDKIGISKYNRFNAILNSNGALGCAYSHKEVIKLYDESNNKPLMVCEDDIQFIGNSDRLITLLENFINDNNLDVLCLAYNNTNQYPYNDYFNLTSDTQTMSCYILKPYMKNVFLKIFELSTKLLEQGIDRIYKPEIDQVWKVLQKNYNFITPKERFAFQRVSYSDIRKKIVDYKV
jgi:GR25 family glycosyltransferase involved in LPS biosynthesis